MADRPTIRLNSKPPHQGRFAEAQNTLTDAIINSQLAPKDRITVKTQANLAIVYQRMGKLQESILLDCQTLQARQDILGPRHPDTIATLARLGLSYLDDGRTAEGQTALANAFEAGASFPGATEISAKLANSYRDQGDRKNALA